MAIQNRRKHCFETQNNPKLTGNVGRSRNDRWFKIVTLSNIKQRIIHFVLQCLGNILRNCLGKTLPHFQLSHKLIFCLGASSTHWFASCTGTLLGFEFLISMSASTSDNLFWTNFSPRSLVAVDTDASTLGTIASRSASATNFLVLETNEPGFNKVGPMLATKCRLLLDPAMLMNIKILPNVDCRNIVQLESANHSQMVLGKNTPYLLSSRFYISEMGVLQFQ